MGSDLDNDIPVYANAISEATTPRARWPRPRTGKAWGAHARAAAFALLAASLVVASEQVVEHFASRSELARQRSDVVNQLSTVRARLEGLINANLFLIEGLTALIATRPALGQDEFAAIARGLVGDRHALRNIGAAPDMVLSLIYPLEGNQAALGIDYREHPVQREAALRARDTGKAVIAGPLPLAQGGVGVIAREPVFVPPAAPGGEPRFWGLVSAVIDVETLYAKAGLQSPDLGLQLAIRGRDGRGDAGPPFFGEAAIFEQQPVTMRVELPGGFWQLAALPASGWGAPGPAIGPIRLLGLLAALAAAALAWRLARAAQRLASHNAELTTLLDTIPDLVWLKDPEGIYLAANPRFRDAFGMTGERLLGSTDGDLLPADAAARTRERELAAIAAGRPQVSEDWLALPGEADARRVETIHAPVHDGEGRLLGILGIARDVTARLRAEAALRESEDRLRLFIEHAPAALAMFDRQMRYLAVSRRWLSDYGLSEHDIIGRLHYEIFPEIPEDWKEAHRRGLSGEVLRVDEERFVRADGTPIWLRWELRPWFAADRSIGGIVIFTEDVSERKQAEQALRASESRFRALATVAPVGIYRTDPAGRCIYVNPRWCEITGMREADAMGEGWIASIHPDDRERVLSGREQAAHSGEAFYAEYQVRPIEGRSTWVIGRALAEYDQRGGFVGLVGTLSDITAIKQMESEIRQLNADLEERVRQRTAQLAELNKELETFTYSVSHDLKAPLRGIDGYSQLLQKGYRASLDEEGNLFLDNIRSGVAQMNELIEDLLAYSRMERRSMHRQSLDLASQIDQALKERHADIEASGMTVEVAIDGLAAVADGDGLALVLRNLLDNAIKFSRHSRSPQLVISATRGEQSVTLSFKDNGIGFDMKFHDRIFEIFQRLQRAEDYPGTGIGLAIASKAMQRMGGRIWAESMPGQGANFFLELPR